MTDNAFVNHEPSDDVATDEREATPSKFAIRIRELLAAVIAVAGGITVLVGVQDITMRETTELGARFWPTLLGWAIIGLGVLLVATNVVPASGPKDEPNPMTGWGISRLVITFVVLIAYLSVFNVLTLWLITFMTVALLLLLYGFRNWKVLIFFPGIIAAVLHVLFVVLLRVPLG